jgi:glutathione S-transferase
MTGYAREAGARSAGFGIQALATGVLMFGALGKAVWLVAQGGL